MRSIDRRLALLSAREERDVRTALAADVLNTEPRRKIFDAIDGMLGNPELAKIGDVTPRATQNFVNQLLECGLVRSVGEGRETIVIRNEDGILTLVPCPSVRVAVDEGLLGNVFRPRTPTWVSSHRRAVEVSPSQWARRDSGHLIWPERT